MFDYSETVAARLSVAADRMGKAGFPEPERRLRDAAARIRAELSFDETRSLVRQLIVSETPRTLNRLTALAATNFPSGSGTGGPGSGGFGGGGEGEGEEEGGEEEGGDLEGGEPADEGLGDGELNSGELDDGGLDDGGLADGGFESGELEGGQPADGGLGSEQVGAPAVGDIGSGGSLAEAVSAASQLSSTAAWVGLSLGLSTGVPGWATGAATINPYTGAAGSSDNPFSGGMEADPSPGTPADGTANWFATGQNINPFTGQENTESFTGGGASPQSPQPSDPASVALGYSGPAGSILNSPDMLALLDSSANSNIATDASGTGPASPPLTFLNEQWGYTEHYLPGNGLDVYNRYDEPAGTMYALQPVNGGTVVIYSTSDRSVVGSLTPDGGFVGAGSVGSPQAPPDSLLIPQQPTPATNMQFVQDAQLNAAIQQAVGSSGPSSVDAGQIAQANDLLGVGNVAPLSLPPTALGLPQNPQPMPADPSVSAAPPYHPMADSPLANWLLYGHDTPVLDFLTNDSHLQTAQNAALGIAIGAGAIATGGLLVEAAPAISSSVFETSISIASRFPTATSIASSVGNALTYTTVPRLAVGLGAAGAIGAAADELPGLENAVANELPAIENAAAGLAEDVLPTGPSFEGVVDVAEFENDQAIIDRLSRARQFDIGGYESLTARGAFGRLGDNLDSDEALQNAYIRQALNVARSSSATRDNPAMALTPALHRLIQNLRTPQMQGMSPEQALQFHLQQMRGFVPDYIISTLEKESLRFIRATF